MIRFALAFALAVPGVFAACGVRPVAGENPDWPKLTGGQAAILADLRSISPPGRPPGKDGELPWLLSVWDRGGEMEGVVSPPSGPGNAAANFRRLEDLYEAERESGPGGVPAVDSEGVEELLKAAETAVCRLSPDYYPVFDQGSARQPDFVVLRNYLQALLNRADGAWRAGRPEEAERCYRAGVVCGRHLSNDRSTLVSYLTGLLFELRSAQGYARFLKLQSRAAAGRDVEDYADGLATLLRAFYWKANTAMGDLKNFNSLPATLEIALRDRELCWRREAVVRLGIYRHGAPDLTNALIVHHSAWEKAAEEALAEIGRSAEDESLRRLAVWAVTSITPDMHRDLRHGFQTPPAREGTD